jgi:hypothetical protein
MAKLYGEIAKNALLTLDKSFSRALGQPLDNSEVYYSLEAAQTYAKTTTAYVGQKIVVIENGVVTHYSVQDTNGTLRELGADRMGVEALAKVDAGKIPQVFYVVDSEAVGEEGAEDYQPEVGHIEIQWVEPAEDKNTVTTIGEADPTIEIHDNGQDGDHAYSI